MAAPTDSLQTATRRDLLHRKQVEFLLLKAIFDARLEDIAADIVEAQKALQLEDPIQERPQPVVKSVGSESREAFRRRVVNALERRFFYKPSYEIYGCVSGFYDYGPPGSAVQSNVLALWRQHFVLKESMLEVNCPCVTPEVVLKASGHVDRFTDLMVKDEKTGTCYRADHLLKDFCKDKLEKDFSLSPEKTSEYKHIVAVLDDLSSEELGEKIKEYGIVAPDSKNPLSEPYPFNLMFQTSIGPSGVNPGYLRPETAQGTFVNFKELYYYNGNKLPFAAAQIGQAFRNEISPRQGLLRVREFTLAEIEHFVDPEDKSHPKFTEVENLEFLMLPRELQLSGQSAKKTVLKEVVAKGIVNNQTLGYFIGRVYLFLTSLGIDKERLRFRQHLANEMAHYAADCWDAEIDCSYGWIECVGIADRSAYDLRAHTEKSGVALVAREKIAKPKEVEKVVITPVRKELGLAFKGSQKKIVEALEAMGEKEAMEMKANLESNGEVKVYICTLEKDVTITKKMVTISKEIKIEHQRVFTPSVIEPSFGIGRIIYCLYEHSFYTRPSKEKNEQLKELLPISKKEDENEQLNELLPISKKEEDENEQLNELLPISKKEDENEQLNELLPISKKDENEQLNVFRFPPLVAPYKCSVFSLLRKQQYEEVVEQIEKALTSAGISCIDDISGTSIGKRYARTDELGVPFAITVDSTSSVTIRERDSKQQIRVSVEDIVSVVKALIDGQWAEHLARDSLGIPFGIPFHLVRTKSSL